jgi:hypothetical protein
MAISSKEVIELLKEWPERVPGSEESLFAREALMARISGEYGVRVSDAGFYTPTSLLPFLLIMTIIILTLIYIASLSPIAGGAGLIAASYYLYRLQTYQSAPFSSFNATRLTSNVTANKGSGDRVMIVCASLDRFDGLMVSQMIEESLHLLEPHKIHLLIGAGALAFLSIVTSFAMLSALCGVALIICLLMYGLRTGENSPGKDSIIGATISAASRCWSRIADDNLELVLLLTDAGGVGQMGALGYLEQQYDRLTGRDVAVFGIEESDLRPFAAKGIACFEVEGHMSTMTPTDMSNALEALILDHVKDLSDAI